MKFKKLLLTGCLMLVSAVALAAWQKPAAPASQALIKSSGTTQYLYNVGTGMFFAGDKDHPALSYTTGATVELNQVSTNHYQLYTNGTTSGYSLLMYAMSASTIWLDGVSYAISAQPTRGEWNYVTTSGNKFKIYNYYTGNTKYLGSTSGLIAAKNTRLYMSTAEERTNAGGTDYDEWYSVTASEFNKYVTAMKTYLAATELKDAIDAAKAKYPSIDIADEQAVYNNGASTVEQLNAATASVLAKVWAEDVKNASLSSPLDFTKFIINPSFEEGNLDGWTAKASNDTGAKDNGSSTYHTEGADGNWLFNTWSVGYPVSQSIEGLPNGIYKLQGKVASTSTNVYLFANDGMKDANDNKVSTHKAVNVGGNADTFANGEMLFDVEDGTITIGAIGAAANGIDFSKDGEFWYKADNFRLTYYGNKADAYKEMLAEALSEASAWFNDHKEALSNDRKDKLSTAIEAAENTGGKTADELKVLLKNLYAAIAEAQEPPHYKIDDSKLVTTAATSLDGVTVVITDPTGTKTWGAFSTEWDGQDIGANYTSVYDWSSKSEYGYVKFFHVAGQADDVYYIKFVNAAGEWYYPRGTWHDQSGCMNVTGDGNGLFVGGLNNQNGQDAPNAALWRVTKTADGYTLYNIGKERYAVPGVGVTSTETSLKFYTEFILFDATPMSHNYADVWSMDETNHWHACTDEGDCDAPKADQAAHSYGNVATETSYYTCSVCQYENATRKTEYEAAVKAAADRAAADAVEALISALGTPDASDAYYAKLQAAQDAYEALTDDQKALVDPGLVMGLSSAAAGYNVAVANAVVDKINAIGTVELTEASKAKIDEARAAYDALNNHQKALVAAEDLKVLTDAEKAYADLEAAAAVVEKIEAIGDVELTPESKALIDDARTAYDALTDDQKALVTDEQLKVLTDAETTYANLKAAQEYRDAHDILTETVNTIEIEDKATVEEALEDLGKLPEGVQAYLTDEKQLLEDLLVHIGYLEAGEDLDDLEDQKEDLEGDRIAMILLNSDEELIKTLEDINSQIEALKETIEEAKETGEPTSDDIKATIADLSKDIEKLYDNAMALYPEGPYGPIIVEMMGFEQMTAKLNERDGDIRGDLKLTNLWNRVMDQVAAEANRLNWDIENNPEPSDLRLGFHFTNVALIHTSFAIYNEAVKQHLTKDEKIQAIFDALLKLVSSRNTMVAQYGAVIEDDAEWNALSARLDAEEAAVNALEGTDPTIEELEAHEAELAAINAAMQAFAAKVESGTTGISSVMQNAECGMQNIYNLAGQKVSDNAKGIVIKNGKKVMVK